MTGNQWVDIWLTAGLGTHRVHHVLPAQKSGFANILSEPVLKEVAAQFSLPWAPTKDFLTERVPPLMYFYLCSDSGLPWGDKRGLHWLILETLHPRALLSMIQYVVLGFTGVDSI